MIPDVRACIPLFATTPRTRQTHRTPEPCATPRPPRVGEAHGTTATHDPRGLPSLPRPHPHATADRTHAVVPGEPDAGTTRPSGSVGDHAGKDPLNSRHLPAWPPQRPGCWTAAPVCPGTTSRSATTPATAATAASRSVRRVSTFLRQSSLGITVS